MSKTKPRFAFSECSYSPSVLFVWTDSTTVFCFLWAKVVKVKRWENYRTKHNGFSLSATESPVDYISQSEISADNRSRSPS